jgi:hypothetical protein
MYQEKKTVPFSLVQAIRTVRAENFWGVKKISSITKGCPVTGPEIKS